MSTIPTASNGAAALADAPPGSHSQPTRQSSERAAIARRRADQVAGFVAAAESAFTLEDFDAAMTACEEVLVREPEHEGALTYLDRIAAIVEERRIAAEREARRLRIEAARGAVALDVDDEEFRRALTRLEEFEREEGHVPELDDLRERASTGLREREHREAVAAAVSEKVARAAQLLVVSDCQGALACLDAALTLDPSHPAAAGLRLQLLESLQRLANPAPEPALSVRKQPAKPPVSEAAVAQSPVTAELCKAAAHEADDPIALFASESELVASAAAPKLNSTRRELHNVTPPSRTPVVMSVRWPGRSSRALLATLALIPGAGAAAYWSVARPPILPLVAGTTIEAAAPAPVVAVTNAASLPSTPAPHPVPAPVPSRPPSSVTVTPPAATSPAADRGAQSAAAPRAATAVPAPISDERAVRAALDTYASAYGALDADAVKRVFPSESDLALQRSFSTLVSQRMEIRDAQMAVAGDAATVSCTLVTSAVGTEPSAAPARDSRRTVFNLARRNGAWVIVDRR